MPTWLTRLRRRVRALLSRDHDRELREELELHLHMLTEEYVERGLSMEDARARARRDFGNPALFREQSRDLFSFVAVEQVLKDLAYTIREIARSPGFTAVAVASLAVGICAVTATASVVDALLLRGLPVPEPDRLVAFAKGNASTWSRWQYGAYQQWAGAPDAPFRAAAVYTLNELEQPLLPGADSRRPEKVRVSLVSGSYFEVLGVGVSAGRPITPIDDRVPGGHRVAVISHAYWRRHFGMAGDIIGRTLELNGVPYEVIGVGAERFRGEWVGQPTDVWLPLSMHREITRARATLLREDAPAQWLRVLARLNEGVSNTQASASANLLWRRFLDRHPAIQSRMGVQTGAVVLSSAASGYAPQRREYARPLAMVAALVILVLVIACANFSNLLYGRSRSRQQEFAVRLVLGAGRWRIVRQSLVECAFLALSAAALGIAASSWATGGALKYFASTLQPLDVDLHLDARTLGVAVVCILLVVAFGLLPTLRWLEPPALCLSRAAMRERRRNLVGRGFLAAQLTFTVILLIASGLMLRTVQNLRAQHLGFDRNVLVITLAPAQAGYSGEAASLLLHRIRAQLLSLSDVQGVSVTGAALLEDRTYWIDGSERLVVNGRPQPPGVSWTFADVGAGFFRTIGMPLVHGREFTGNDVNGPSDAVIINRSMSRLLFGSGSALGKRLAASPASPELEIVGVVDDALQTSPRNRGLAVMYRPLQETPPQVQLVVRTSGDAAERADVIWHNLIAADTSLPVLDVRTIDDVLNEAIGQERLLGFLAAWLGMLVVIVSCIGVHALISNDVVERTHEMGVRFALGATRARVARLVLRDAAILVLLAVAVGVPLGMAAVQPLSSQLYGVKPHDPWTVAVAVLLLLCVALAAAARPACAAARVDPLVLLRAD